MGNKKMAWVGVALVVWPVVRAVALHFGVDLPDINDNFGDWLSMGSQVGGVALLAKSEPLGKKKRR